MVCLYLEKPVTRKVKSAYTLCNFGQIIKKYLCKSANMVILKSTKYKNKIIFMPDRYGKMLKNLKGQH